MSGCGLPGRPSAAATTPSTTTGKRSARCAAASTGTAFFELETIAAGMPSIPSRSSTASEPGYAAMPSDSSSEANTAFFRLPMPHTVSASSGSLGSPSGTSTPREARSDRTPS